MELPKVAQVNNEKLTKPITAQEVQMQTQGLKDGKFPDQITLLLVTAYRHALDKGKWAQTWSSSVVTLIHKEGKYATKCESYRQCKY